MRKIFNFRLFPIIALSLISGIILCFCNYYFGFNFCAIFIFAVFIAYITAAIFAKKLKLFNLKKLIVLFLCFLSFGLGAFSFYNKINDNYKKQIEPTECLFIGDFDEVKSFGEGYCLIFDNVEITSVSTGAISCKDERVLVFSKQYSGNFYRGDRVSFFSKLYSNLFVELAKIDNYSMTNRCSFKTYYEFSEVNYELIVSRPDIFQKIRSVLSDTLKKFMPERERTLAEALLFGNTSEVDKTILDSFRLNGVAHIFAVSGLHIGFLAALLNFLLRKVKSLRLLKFILIGAILIFYSGICGWTVSSKRAVIMCIIYLFADTWGEKNDGLNTVSFSAYLILLLNCFDLFSLGFQLSFAAVSGILFLKKPTEKVFCFLPKKVRESASVVCSAQLGVLPLCINVFGFVSPLSLIFNLIFIPAVSIIFTLLFLAVVFATILQLGFLLYVPTQLIYAITFYFYAFGNHSIIIGGFSFGAGIVTYYLAMLSVSEYIYTKKLTKILIVCLLIGTTTLLILFL